MEQNGQLELFAHGPFTLRLTIEEALSIFVDEEWGKLPSYKASRAHLRRIRDFFNPRCRYIDAVSKLDIQAFRLYLKDFNLKENTINKAHMIMTRLYNFLGERKEIGTVNGIDYSKITMPDRNPGALVPKVDEKQFRRKVAWPKKVVKKLINTALLLEDVDLAEIIQCLYELRLRHSDFFALTEQNVDMARLIVSGIQRKTVRRNFGGVSFLLSIPEASAKIIGRRILDTKPGTCLFRTTNLRKRFDRVRKAASLPYVKMIDLRPSNATLLFDNGIDALTVSEMLGHTTLRMLPVYAIRTLKHQVNANKITSNDEKDILAAK